MPSKYLAILFDIDGTLITSGGAGAASWRMAFDHIYGIPADIGQYTDTGMTDPDVGRQTFAAVMHRQPSRAEFAKLLERRLYYLYQTVADQRITGSLTASRSCCPASSMTGTCWGS